MFKKILIANDGSVGAFKALTTALQLAHSYKARAHMICVDEVSWVQVRLQEEVINEISQIYRRRGKSRGRS